ncbi:hypothetical protein [Ferrovibrio sp.]|uniref:hypothetical protein n=1 Tax=Ferrovibrio sp. TaxID=1917215 RepID=UPI0035AEB8C9
MNTHHLSSAEILAMPDDVAVGHIPVSSRYQRSDILAWLLALDICDRLRMNPNPLMVQMEAGLADFQNHRIDPQHIERWGRLIHEGAAAVCAVLMEDSDRGAHLRQSVPGRNLVDLDMRERLFQKALKLYKAAVLRGWAA